MTVPFAFSAATSAIPLSQLDTNFNTTITLGNTAIQLGNTVTTLNNMTLANVTISSGNVTITNVTVTTANVTTVNATTVIATTANVTTANVATSIVTGSETLSYGTVNGVAYLNGSKVLTTGSVLTFDGTNLGLSGGNPAFIGNSSSTAFYIDNRTTGKVITFRVSNAAQADTEAMTIASASGGIGAVGIGYTSLTSVGNNGLAVAGNVGIGTSSPGQKLDVVGSAKASSALVVGDSSGNASGTMTNESDVSKSVTFNADPANAGASSFMRWNVDGSERMHLDSSGNLGLGVTPNAGWAGYKAIQVGTGASFGGYTADVLAFVGSNCYNDNSNWRYLSSGNVATRYQQSGGVHQWYNAPSGTAGNAITFTQAMTLDASGNLLVGRTNTFSDAKFIAEGASTSFISRLRNTSATTPSGLFVTYTAAAPNGTGELFLRCDDSAATRAEIRSNGGLANYSANDVNLSDRREKTNFAPAKSYLDAICAIPVQTFNYIDQSEDDPGLTLGVVAQDVQAVAPELVMESNWGSKDDPKMRLSIYQTDLQYALMKCIQEQQAIIEQLKADVAALKGA